MDVLFQNFGLQNAGRHEGQNNDEYAEGDAVLVARGNICRDESFGKAKEHTSDDCTISPEAMPQAPPLVTPTLMPTALAAVSSSAAARMAVPNFVFVIKR